MPSPQGREVIANGLQTYVIDQGDGQPIVMLHGMASTSDSWAYVFEGLGKEYRLVAPDMPGHGRSAGGNRSYSFAFYVDWLEGLLDSLNIKTAVLMGNSMGGGVSLAFALAHPERVERLVMVDALGMGETIPWRAGWIGLTRLPYLLMASITGRIDPYFLRFFEGWICVDPWDKAHTLMIEIARVNLRKGFWSFGAGVRLLIADLLRGAKWREFARKLAAIEISTLIIWGRYDELLPLAHGIAGAERMPNARLAIFEQSSHSPMMEEPKKFNAAIKDFLTDRKSKSRREPKKINGRRIKSSLAVRS